MIKIIENKYPKKRFVRLLLFLLLFFFAIILLQFVTSLFPVSIAKKEVSQIYERYEFLKNDINQKLNTIATSDGDGNYILINMYISNYESYNLLINKMRNIVDSLNSSNIEIYMNKKKIYYKDIEKMLENKILLSFSRNLTALTDDVSPSMMFISDVSEIMNEYGVLNDDYNLSGNFFYNLSIGKKNIRSGNNIIFEDYISIIRNELVALELINVYLNSIILEINT